MFALLSAAALILGAACQASAASFDPATPPDWLVYSYPTTDVVVNQTVTLGINGGALYVPHDYYGFGYNLSISTVLPNNTNVLWMYISNLDEGNSTQTHCAGFGRQQKGSLLLDSVTFAAHEVGQYTALWNITYGTSDDQSVVNQTSCDTSRLSYQTWVFNATFNVVEATSNGNILPAYTTVTSDYPSTPTGKIFESNNAWSLAPNLPVLVLSTLALILSRVV